MAGFRCMDIKMWIFFLTVVWRCVYSTSDEEFHVCKNMLDNCATDDCTMLREQLCYHGDCTDKGSCTCHPCWAGKFCNETDNRYPPTFDAPHYEAPIPPDTEKGEHVINITANDRDAERSRCDDFGIECSCADMYFKLDTMDSNAPKLGINPASGSIHLEDDGPLSPGIYKYKVSVTNLDGLQGPPVTLKVVVETNKWNTIVKSRQLRAVPDVTGLTPISGDLACSLEMDPADAAITTVTPGDTFTLIFKATIPANSYAADVVVEIFTDDIDGTFAILCEPTPITLGTLEVDTANVTPVLSSYTSGFRISLDTATYNLGIVKNGGGSEAFLTVSFPVTIIDEPNIQDGDTYWLSTGIEYSGGTRVWIGQLGFLVSRVVETEPATTADLTGAIAPAVDQPHKYTLDILSYQRRSTMSVSVSTEDVTQNNICRMEVCSFGNGYSCVDYTRTATSYTYDNATGHNGAASIPFDVISYAGALSNNMDSLITLDVITYTPSTALGIQQTLTAEVTENGAVTLSDSHLYTPAAAINSIIPAGSTLTDVTAVASCAGDPCQLAYGESVQYEVTIIVPFDTTFAPVEVRFVPDLLADGVTPAMGSCATPIASFDQVDDDIACGKAWKNKVDTMVMVSGGNTVFQLGGVMNMGYNTGADATIKLSTTLFFSSNAVAATNYAMNVEVHAGGSLTTKSLPSVTTSANPTEWSTPLAPVCLV
ncbi:uncharacterized protein [Amphiura filiformis]|uniref:uncharacterized protein n=1 Tax=Amphiura filiformis TaxID=82378 RepID=UPI003B222580